MSGHRYQSEDGSEHTGSFPTCGINGSFRTYVPVRQVGNKAPPAIAEKLAEQRMRFACQGAARPRA